MLMAVLSLGPVTLDCRRFTVINLLPLTMFLLLPELPYYSCKIQNKCCLLLLIISFLLPQTLLLSPSLKNLLDHIKGSWLHVCLSSCYLRISRGQSLCFIHFASHIGS